MAGQDGRNPLFVISGSDRNLKDPRLQRPARTSLRGQAVGSNDVGRLQRSTNITA
jgi:hypothetical protein